jgi:acetylornithine deacetylase/succinyl-diaminopimelate desuccinylase-like protein
VKLTSICCIFLLMATLSARAAEESIEKIAQDPGCARAIAWIDQNTAWVTDQQIRLTEIPAPEFKEARRGEALKKLFEANGLRVRVDKIGNVIGERPGASAKEIILLVAHLDTVFPNGTNVTVKHNASRLEAPGIADNGAGLAALVAVSRALSEGRVRTTKTLVFAGDVGEEGEGNLRGIRALVDEFGPRLSAVIAIDGPSTEHVTTQGIASRRFEVTITGPGGHSWSDFGVPNPITAISRGIVKFSSIRIPDDPRSSYNFGVIEGGTSVNSIPARAIVKIDLRSEEEPELDRLERALRESMQAGMKDEMNASRTGGDSLRLEITSLGARPSGKLPEDSPLLETVRNVDRFLGTRSRIERSSTDANIPLSQGIPAIAIGGGGKGSGSHTLNEWYDPTGRELGLKRVMLIGLALAGVQP